MITDVGDPRKQVPVSAVRKAESHRLILQSLESHRNGQYQGLLELEVKGNVVK